jgi:hypothetical protein
MILGGATGFLRRGKPRIEHAQKKPTILNIESHAAIDMGHWILKPMTQDCMYPSAYVIKE